MDADEPCENEEQFWEGRQLAFTHDAFSGLVDRRVSDRAG